MMKKLGFTLAEVLITLGIIGVVAALTAPALVMSNRNQANAAKLSVVVSNLENAFTSAIAQEGADNLYGTRMWSQNRVNATEGDQAQFVGELGRYLVVSGFKGSDLEFYEDVGGFHPMTETGTTNTGITIDHFGGDGVPFTIMTKNGAAIFIRTYNRVNEVSEQREDAIAEGCTYYTNAADIMIDYNCDNKARGLLQKAKTYAEKTGDNDLINSINEKLAKLSGETQPAKTTAKAQPWAYRASGESEDYVPVIAA